METWRRIMFIDLQEKWTGNSKLPALERKHTDVPHRDKLDNPYAMKVMAT